MIIFFTEIWRFRRYRPIMIIIIITNCRNSFDLNMIGICLIKSYFFEQENVLYFNIPNSRTMQGNKVKVVWFILNVVIYWIVIQMKETTKKNKDMGIYFKYFYFSCLIAMSLSTKQHSKLIPLEWIPSFNLIVQLILIGFEWQESV